MKIVIFILFISFSSLAQSPEKLLQTILNPPNACSTSSHCENFHASSCESKDFAYDGTSSIRSDEEWNEKLKNGKEQIRGPLERELLSKYQKLNSDEWNEYLSFLNVEPCAMSECQSRVSALHADRLIESAVTFRKQTSIFQKKVEPQGKDFVEILGMTSFYEKQKTILLDSVRYKEDEEKMLSMVTGIKDALKAKIREMISDQEKQKELFDKLDKTTFKGFGCGDNDHLQSYFDEGAFNTRLEDGRREITYCAGNFRKTGSSFNLAYLLAHEFSHSIDPCSVRPKDTSKMDRVFLESQHPFSNVIACLRSPDSVKADWSEDFYDQNVPSQTLCMEDQISESFSDWMAAEVVPGFIRKLHPNLSTENYKEGFMNISRTLKCDVEISHSGGVDSHPKPVARINSIMMTNRSIRDAVGCGEVETSKVQCTGKNDLSTLRPPPKKIKKGPFPGLQF